MSRVIVVVLIVLALAIGVAALLILPPMLQRIHAQGARSNCKNNLKQLGLGMILYRDNQGAGLQFPAFDGSDLLIHLYLSGVAPEPDVLLCPESGDTNDDGRAIRYGNTACTSYAAWRNASNPLPTTAARGAGESAFASDDSEGPVPFNHGDRCVVLFLDGHVEEVGAGDARMPGATRVGQPGTLLEQLAN